MLLRIAFLSLWQHRRRTGVLMTAIGLVTALMIFLLGVGEGMNRALVEASTTLMSGHVNVAGFFKVTAGQAAPLVTHVKEVTDVIRKEVPELTYIAARGRGWAKVISESGSTMIGLAGVNIDEATMVRELVALVRDRIGPVAAFKDARIVKRLPKTRSGKILRASIRRIADGQPANAPATIDDPTILDEIGDALKR